MPLLQLQFAFKIGVACFEPSDVIPPAFNFHTARDDFNTALAGLIAAAREAGLSDEEIIGELAETAEALREGLS